MSFRSSAVSLSPRIAFGAASREADCGWLAADYEARTQGSFVEKKVSSVTFHYRNADPVFGVFQGSSSGPAPARGDAPS